MKGVWLAVIFLLSMPVAFAPFTGIVDGYIYLMNGSTVQGAAVDATVVGCAGGGCSGNYTSESTGYYVIGNLNDAYLRPGTLVVDASKNITGVGYASGSVTESVNALVNRINVTMCIPPTKPVLVDEGNTHNDSAVLEWTSGSDPLGFTIYDEFKLNSNPVVSPATSPRTQSGLSNPTNVTHTWNVRTCNSNGTFGCCSSYASDTFIFYNNPPPVPNLTDEPDGHYGNVSLEWTSGVDPDGDAVHDEFELVSVSSDNNAASPKNFTGLGFGAYTWRVRTCDSFGACSAWATDTFTIGNTAPSPPTLVDEPPTQSSSVLLEWTPGIDAENDTTYDEYQLSLYPDFSNISSSDSNASSPMTETSLPAFTVFYWRVRTCDSFNACSSYSDDVFFTYSCPACPSGGGGGGGGGGGTRIIEKTCNPLWECTNWGTCLSGVQRRKCIDKNNCVQIPSTVISCVTEKGLERKELGKFYLGNLSDKDIIRKGAPFDKVWVFDYEGTSYEISMIEHKPLSLAYKIMPVGIYGDIKLLEAKLMDMTNNNKDDVLFTLDMLTPKQATISLIKLAPGKRVRPTPEQPLFFNIYLFWILIFILIFEFVILNMIGIKYHRLKKERYDKEH